MACQLRVFPPVERPAVLDQTMQEYASALDHKKPSELQPSEAILSSDRLTIIQTGVLNRLPVELLYNIVRYLRVSETACFSLTCRELYQNEHLQQLWTSDLRGPPRRSVGYERLYEHYYRRLPEIEERLRFSMLLWMDLPNHSLCGRCFIFYRKCKQLSGWFNCGDCGRDQQHPLRQVIPGHFLPGWCMRAVWDYVARTNVRDKTLDCLTLERCWQTRYDKSGEVPATGWIRSTINVEIMGWLPVTHACQRLLHTLEYRRSNPEARDLTNQLLARRAVRSLQICGSDYHSPWSEDRTIKLSMSDLTELINDKACKNTSKTRKCSHCSTEYRWTVYRHGIDISEIVLDTWRIFDPRMVTFLPAVESLNQYSAQSFPESDASKIDDTVFVTTILQPPQIPESFGCRALRALKRTSLWIWLRNKIRKSYMD